MGGRQWRSRPRVWQAMAQLGRSGWKDGGPDHAADRPDQKDSRQPAVDRERLECGGASENGADALSYHISILCGGWKAELPVIPAERRCLPGGPVQCGFL